MFVESRVMASKCQLKDVFLHQKFIIDDDCDLNHFNLFSGFCMFTCTNFSKGICMS